MTLHFVQSPQLFWQWAQGLIMLTHEKDFALTTKNSITDIEVDRVEICMKWTMIDDENWRISVYFDSLLDTSHANACNLAYLGHVRSLTAVPKVLYKEGEWVHGSRQQAIGFNLLTNLVARVSSRWIK